MGQAQGTSTGSGEIANRKCEKPGRSGAVRERAKKLLLPLFLGCFVAGTLIDG